MESHELDMLEKRVLASFHSDGAAETLMGIALGLAGFHMAAQSDAPTIGILPVIVILLARAWKKRITYPRLGYAGFAKRGRTKRLTVVLTLLTVTAVALVAIQYLPTGSGKLVMGLIVSAAITLPAILKGMRHFYLFGLLCFGLIAASTYIHVSAGYAIAATGAILLVVGLIRLKNFLDQHPKQMGEAPLGA
ncbi:MAG: hypothetical protein H6507_05495 [Calditrichaeota bacterium]|nr:hypothetical protein [Calditrichota bacterium]